MEESLPHEVRVCLQCIYLVVGTRYNGNAASVHHMLLFVHALQVIEGKGEDRERRGQSSNTTALVSEHTAVVAVAHCNYDQAQGKFPNGALLTPVFSGPTPTDMWDDDEDTQQAVCLLHPAQDLSALSRFAASAV